MEESKTLNGTVPRQRTLISEPCPRLVVVQQNDGFDVEKGAEPVLVQHVVTRTLRSVARAVTPSIVVVVVAAARATRTSVTVASVVVVVVVVLCRRGRSGATNGGANENDIIDLEVIRVETLQGTFGYAYGVRATIPDVGETSDLKGR